MKQIANLPLRSVSKLATPFRSLEFRRRPSEGQSPSTAAAFTLIELLVVISIIALLISILLPGLKMARESARTVVCASNLRSVNFAAAVYANDHEGKLLRDGNTGEYVWTFAIRDYLAGPNMPALRRQGAADDVPPAEVFVCPSADYVLEQEWETTYAQNMLIGWSWLSIDGWQDRFLTELDLVNPSQTIYFMDYHVKFNAVQGRVLGSRGVHPRELANLDPDPMLSLRHNERGNVAWADGSMGTVDEEALNLDQVTSFWDLSGLPTPWDFTED